MLTPIVWQLLSKEQQKKILQRPVISQKNISEKVKLIIKRVRQEGDRACLELTEQFDGVEVNYLQVTEEEINYAYQLVGQETIQTFKRVMEQLYAFHLPQKLMDYKVETSPGVFCENQIRPLQRVGIYIPGGSAPLVSTVLMTGIPSQIAGCPMRVLCSPPDKAGNINPHILVAAQLCGINKIYKIGGAQAIAAMAYGTETVLKVNKIVGPGNAWVTAAKIQVSLDVSGAQYDCPAGPSELMIIADRHANPRFIAADLLSQAEHGSDSQVILLCTDKELTKKVNEELDLQLVYLSRRGVAESALKNSKLMIVENILQAIDIANEYAPEHLILQIDQPRNYVEKIYCAGSVFLGKWSPESAGDYASGTNHVLPTNGYAKSLSGLSVKDFLRTLSVQELSREGLINISDAIKTLAGIEGLDAHINAVNVRVEENKNVR